MSPWGSRMRQMCTATWFVLTVLTVKHTVGAEDDPQPSVCNVLITGPDQQWTPSKVLRKKRLPMSSGKLRFIDQPSERREIAFDVRSAADSLHVLLYAELALSEILLTLDAKGWRVDQTHPVLSNVLIDYGQLPAGPVLAADEWLTYSVSVEQGASGALRLHRLHEDGTRTPYLQARFPTSLLVDTVKVRAVMSDTNSDCQGDGNGGWNFWTFDTLHQKAGLCSIWPSPHLSDTSDSGVTLRVGCGGSLQLQMFGTSRHFYLLTLSPSELTVKRVELGVPTARHVLRLCRTMSTAQVESSGSIELHLLGYGREERPAPDDRCQHDGDSEGQTEGSSGDGSGLYWEEGSVDHGSGWQESAMESSYSHNSDPDPTGPLVLEESPEADADDMLDAHNLTETTLYPAPVIPLKAPEQSEVPHEMSMTATPAALQSADPPELELENIISWPDGLAFYVISRKPAGNGQASWTYDCSAIRGPPERSKVTSADGRPRRPVGACDLKSDAEERAESTTPTSFYSRFQGYSANDGGADSAVWPGQPVLVTATLSAVSSLLLMATLVLAGLLFSRRHRRRASFTPEKAELFGAPASAGLELVESGNSDSSRQRSLLNPKHGVSTFKPMRRQAAMAKAIASPEPPAQELPLPPQTASSQETPADLPPPPDSPEAPQLRREGTPPLPPLPVEQRTSVLPPQPNQLLPPLSPDVIMEPIWPPLAAAAGRWEESAAPLPPPPVPPAPLLSPPAAEQMSAAGDRDASQLPPPPDV